MSGVGSVKQRRVWFWGAQKTESRDSIGVVKWESPQQREGAGGCRGATPQRRLHPKNSGLCWVLRPTDTQRIQVEREVWRCGADWQENWGQEPSAPSLVMGMPGPACGQFSTVMIALPGGNC